MAHWGFIRRAFRDLRRWLFSKPRPEGGYLRIPPDDVGLVEPTLGEQSYAPNWEQSYYKRGEDLNLARIYFDDVQDIRWWQHHVRGWIHDDGSLWLIAHREPEPTEYPQEHLDGVGYARDPAMADLRLTLDSAGLAIDNEDWTRG